MATCPAIQMKAWQAEVKMGILTTQTGFNRGDHIIFRGFSGEDIYGTITGISDMEDTHFSVETDNGSGWHVNPANMVHAD